MREAEETCNYELGNLKNAAVVGFMKLSSLIENNLCANKTISDA